MVLTIPITDLLWKENQDAHVFCEVSFVYARKAPERLLLKEAVAAKNDPMSNPSLPVWRLQSEIVRILTDGNRLVLVAATGSGKTTQVPQMLLDAGIAGAKRIVIMQPRRVAARTVATRVAWERGCSIGSEVGYQVRMEGYLSEASRLCFVTEGILLRWLQNDQELDGVGVVIFDEFHERNLLSDVGLALVKRLQQTSRPDLKIVVMSATLDAESVAMYLSETGGKTSPILISEGRAFPVSIRWASPGDQRAEAERAADAVGHIISGGDPGDILVFMPGAGEIQSALNALRAAGVGERNLLIPLHGNLTPAEQDRAFQPAQKRKIVVATNVAETSVTIDGVCHVVDCGLARIARYDGERGLHTLGVEEISRASAEQRAGRAGRTAPGTCWRLWTEGNHLTRPAKNTPEIQRADLAETVLLLHSFGIKKAAEFDWLDRPDSEAVERAEELLRILGALSSGALTPIGRQMLRLPMHPRYSRMLIEAAQRGCVLEAALCAALVSGRDLLLRANKDDPYSQEVRERFEENTRSDFYTLISAHALARSCKFDVNSCQRAGIHAQTARQVEDTFGQMLQIAKREGLLKEKPREDRSVADPEALEKCLLAGFIDQLAVRSDPASSQRLLTGGRTGALVRESVVDAPIAVVASVREVEGRGGRMVLLGLATAVKPEWITEIFPQHLTVNLEHVFDRTHKRVAAVRQERCLGLLIGQKHQKEVEGKASGDALAEAFGNGWFELPNFGHEQKQFVARVNLMCAALPELDFPQFDGPAMRRVLSSAFAGHTLVKEAQTVELRPHLRRHLAPEQIGWLDELLPLSIPWPDGRSLKLAYPEAERPDEPAWPSAQIKLSDCWALKAHPVLGEGKIPVWLRLLLPDGKRLDETTDFLKWKSSSYPKHRAAVKTKYPGFAWP
ncbi:MAG: ATP-dependent helicase HrpB [Verrucomicrobia bacterium]|nr:MAG: ATP-dependent helicase HrpB [Verrucomicrobiota bacterium]